VPGLEAALVRDSQAQARAEAKDQRAREYYQSLCDEAERRCEDMFENDEHAILTAKLKGTWANLRSQFLDEVKAEGIEQGRDITNQELSAIELDQAREVGLLRIITDADNSEALRKLGRYEAGLINTIFRILRLLKAELNAAKVINM
jgi:hypothetical protein